MDNDDLIGDCAEPESTEPDNRVYVGNRDSYRLLYRIGKGMGRNYVAEEASTGKKKFIKRPPIEGGVLMEDVYAREKYALKRMRHPHVIPLQDHNAPQEEFFLVFPYFPVHDLETVLDTEGRLRAQACAAILAPICDALHATHARGMIYRDMKPSNILLSGTRGPLLIDFGLIKHPDLEHLEEEGTVFGTPHFMSPEQVCGDDLTPASDIYSLGVMLYQMLTGEIPLDGETARAVMGRRLAEDVPDPRDLVPETPSRVASVVCRATRHDPRQRYLSTDELKEALIRATQEPRSLFALLFSYGERRAA